MQSPVAASGPLVPLPLPASHRPGSLPRRLLVPGEVVLFETRPSFLGYSWIRLLIYGFFLLILLSAAVADPIAFTSVFWWFGTLLFAALAAHRIYVWSQSAYALTDRRIVSTAGLISNNLRELSVLQIQEVHVGLGVWRNITFRYVTQFQWMPGTVVQNRVTSMTWLDVPDPVEVANYCSQALPYLVPKLIQSQNVQKEGQKAAMEVAERLARTIRCPYCGNGVDVGTLTPEKHDCPSCGAPILLPPPPPPPA